MNDGLGTSWRPISDKMWGVEFFGLFFGFVAFIAAAMIVWPPLEKWIKD